MGEITIALYLHNLSICPNEFYMKIYSISFGHCLGRQVATPTWMWEEIGHHSGTVRGADHRTPQCHSRAKEKDREAPN